MIKCVDSQGTVLPGILRVPGSNAVIFEQTDDLASYIREKNQIKRIAELEDKVSKMMEFINSIQIK